MHDPNQSQPDAARPDRPKQRYEKPQLIVYGDIGALTHNVGANGNPDGGKKTGQKSSLP